MLSLSLFGSGVFMAVFGLRENIWMIGISGFLLFAMFPFANASLDFLLRTNIDNNLQGRAWGLIGFISQLGYVAAYALSGVLADYLFTPLLLPGGALAGTVGTVFGVGAGRGIGFLITMAGLFLCVTAVFLLESNRFGDWRKGAFMKSRMIWNDIARNKAVALMLLLFVSAAAMLLSSAAVLGANLSGSIDRLMQDARTPHFMQMHTGELELDRLEAFAAEQAQVSQFQVVRFLNMDNDSIEINGGTLSCSLQDNGFCTQSGQFDFLLDADGVPVRPADGEVYAPVFYRKDGVMKLGDTISIHGLRFTIAGFVRDSQMNSALASSKRFVVSEADYARLEPFGAVEYLIEFCLDDRSHLGAFTAAYSAAGLPANGPALTWPLFRMMSAISDGIMIAVVLLVGILVILIALLCIRFTLLAKIEDDYREIGTMKAIGMRVSDIRSLYLSTYGAILAAGCVLGFGLSLLFVRLMTGGIRQNLGSSGNDTAAFLLGLAGVLLLFLLCCST